MTIFCCLNLKYIIVIKMIKKSGIIYIILNKFIISYFLLFKNWSYYSTDLKMATKVFESARTRNVDLGFVEETESWKLKSKFFPSKVGGRPAWLNLKDLPTGKHLECEVCGKPLLFLLQIYAPVEDSAIAFHRTIFVFVCQDPKCCRINGNTNFAVFRCQLTKGNQFYSSEPPVERKEESDNPSAEQYHRLCEVCGCPGTKQCSRCHKGVYCSRHHQIIDWKSGHKFVCTKDSDNKIDSQSRVTMLNHNFLLPEYELVIEMENSNNNEPESEKSEEEKMSEYKKILKESKAHIFMRNKDLSEDDLAEMAMKDDKMFSQFSKIVRQNPEQVIRYDREGMPLWLSCTNIPLSKQISNCPCGAERLFEFQIMPQLLNYLKLDSVEESIDWGILAIYTCSKNCDFGPAYKKEVLWKQDLENNNQMQTDHKEDRSCEDDQS